jgi:LacI family transcriptional regulator
MGDRAAEDLLIEEMVERQVDGIIYATLAASLVTVPEKLRDVRAVLLNCLDPERDLPAVLPDDRLGGQAAVEHLLAAGLAGPLHVVGEDPSPEATAGRDRMAGISAALADAGMSLAGVVSCPWGVRPAYDAADAWLRTGARPGALICLNDRIAMGVYQALAEHGLAVPDDVAVISFDGSEMASWLRPRVTSLGLPFRAMGTLAVETLMSSGHRRPAGVVRLPLALQKGESV